MAGELLDWYDRFARVLPWRAPPGAPPPPAYAVWLSEVMLQQTTVAAAGGYFTRFLARWPTVGDLAAAEDAEVMAAWAGLGYYARARNLLACARVVAHERGGRFPDDEAGLIALPGVGPYTAAAIAAIAFGRRAVVVDGNVERVMARLGRIETPLPAAKPLIRALADRLTPDARPGDYAQAVMDLGATICTPRAPACGICPWRDPCAARAAGDAERLPARAEKPAKPVRHGIAWLALRDDGAVLAETRPARGLLGGMLALPSTEWTEAGPAGAPPFPAAWRDLGVEARHTFTHFHLILRVHGVRAPAGSPGDFRPAAGLDAALPTVMRKALRLGLPALQSAGA
ncbi:MAG: A/G-specific adenine glycosylase [Amaricoccus sp.]|uniref:A/G-specific adenine glycosylase n=1 Tax=Amaricoccus sp. TaxID=1872485 RepID=UPI0039E3172B